MVYIRKLKHIYVIPIILILIFFVFLRDDTLNMLNRLSFRATNSGHDTIIRVGYLRLLSATPLYTALHEGYFSNEGLDVQIRVIRSGPEGNEALAANNVDVAFSILPSLIVARVQGVPADLVSLYGTSVDNQNVRDHRVIVPMSSPISMAKDLRGKKVAVVGWPGRTSDALELLDYLKRHNINQNDLTLVGMAHSDMVSALESGLIDAAASAEPYISLGIRSSKIKTLDENEGYYYNANGETEVTTYLTRLSWIQANPARAQRFLRALDRGRKKAEDLVWLVNLGLPFFNLRANPPIDFVQLTPAEAGALRLMPIRSHASVAGLTHVTEQLLRYGPIKEAPNDLSALLYSTEKEE